MKKYKGVIISGIVVLFIAVLILIGSIFAENFLASKINNQQVGTYQVKSRKVKVNLLSRQIKIRDAVMEDTLSAEKIIIPEITAWGVGIFPLLFHDKLTISKLTVTHPEIKLIKKTSQNDAKKNIRQKKDTGPLRIKKLEIHEALFTLQSPDNSSPDTLFSFQTSIKVRNLNINSKQERLVFRQHSAEQFQVSITNGRINLPGGLYQLTIDSLAFRSEARTLTINNLHLGSLYSKYGISEHTGVETDWYDISLPRVELKDINLDALTTDTAIVFKTALLEHLDAKIFRDKRPPFPEKPDTQLPMEMLESLPFAFHADSILIKESDVTYEERVEDSKKAGIVTFNRLYATAYNFSTIDSFIKGQTALTARALVMNEALLQAEFVFPNREFSYQYRASGHLEPINLAAFNPMIMPAGSVRIKEGQLSRLEFDFTYDAQRSTGDLALEYKDLDIVLLDQQSDSKEAIKTFLTETFVLEQDNLKGEDSYQKGSISFERDKKKSIFNYWWKSLFSGIKDVLAF